MKWKFFLLNKWFFFMRDLHHIFSSQMKWPSTVILLVMVLWEKWLKCQFLKQTTIQIASQRNNSSIWRIALDTEGHFLNCAKRFKLLLHSLLKKRYPCAISYLLTAHLFLYSEFSSSETGDKETRISVIEEGYFFSALAPYFFWDHLSLIFLTSLFLFLLFSLMAPLII